VVSRWDWRGNLDLWSRLRRRRPALLHLHQVSQDAHDHLASLARAAGILHLVLSEHGVGAPGINPAIDTVVIPPRPRPRPELQRADAVTAVCATAAEALIRDHGLERPRVRVVGNGADPPDEEREWPAARRLRDDLGILPFRPLWVCAARLEPQKGHAVLLDALALLKERGLDFVVVLAGEGAEREALEARVAKTGLEGRVRFVGLVESLGPLLAAADACVLPSWWEGLPHSLLEALARARPGVATRVGGVPDVIEDGVGGRLVPAGDAQALAAVLEDFHRKPDAARRLGRAGAARVRADFTWARIVEGFEAVYDEVLGLASFAPTSRDDADPGARRGGH
jgi:glycosyltransferase involved in cell wall biosynthesis